MANVGKSNIHGSYGLYWLVNWDPHSDFLYYNPFMTG